MSLVEIWVNTALAQAVGWTLLHSLWQGAAVAAGLAAALAALRSPRARYAAACGALLLLLGGLGLTAVRVMPESVQRFEAARKPSASAWNVPPGPDASAPSVPGLAALVPWLTPFWLAGVWILTLRHVGGWFAVRRLRRQGVCCPPEPWRETLARLTAHLRLARPVQLLESCLADVPMVLGHFRPVILMPVGLLTGLPAAQIEAILLHELAHIRRYDYLVNVGQRLVECLLFYHPAVWWISRVIREERESCCDDVAVAAGSNAPELARALATLEEKRWSDSEPALAAKGGSLMKRIRHLLYPPSPNGAWTPLVAALILMATAAVALAAWPPKPSGQTSTSLQHKTGTAETSSYDRWLSEEVVYIVTDEERAAFKKLTSDEEREKFIEQFWERRNPSPGSPENEFREEYYRRIAYANKHWASTRPGWKTDRGHVYILYGPPDEIDSRPSGSPHPNEVWIYRYIDGIGKNVTLTFVDHKETGDYPLVGPLPVKPQAKASRQ